METEAAQEPDTVNTVCLNLSKYPQISILP